MKRKPLTNKEGEVRELTREDFRAMRPASEVLPPELLKAMAKRKRGQRGEQKQPKKILLSIRYSPEVVEYFKSSGVGWQIRMNEVLKKWVKNHQRKKAA